MYKTYILNKNFLYKFIKLNLDKIFTLKMKGRICLEHLNELWQNVLSQAEQKLSKPSFETWLKSTTLLAYHADTVTISAPNAFARDWLENHYMHLITGILTELTGEDLIIKFVVQKEQDDDFELPPPITQAKMNDQHEFSPGMLNPKYTFDTFVIGSGNRFAHAASLAVAEAPAKAYNPFFIYGGVGLGKTHLMHAIGHYVLEHNPNAKVVYLSSEKFTNEFINSIRDNKTIDFRNKYRNVDVLLLMIFNF